jgi:hypothetical protein
MSTSGPFSGAIQRWPYSIVDTMRRRFVSVIALFFVAFASARASGKPPEDAFERQHQEALATNPTDLHLKIDLDPAQTAFHIGDAIRLKYEWTADVPDKYVAGARYLDFWQRSVLETFIADKPSDARDPLREYWAIHKVLAGNISGPREPNLKLDKSPQFDTIELTHCLRFTKPGRYRLYVVTRSVIPRSVGVTERGGPAIASDNYVTVQILPQNMAAGSREIDEIVARAHQTPMPRFTPVEAWRLFEIGTPRARKVAASLYTRRNSSAWAEDIAMATVLAAPTHAQAITLLRARMNDTSMVADETLIMELSLQELIQKNPKLTAGTVRDADRTAIAAWRAEFAEEVAANWRIVASNVDRRPPDIRASTLRWLDHMNTYYFGSQMLPLPEADRDRIRAQHLAAMPDLPYNELANDLLNFRWSKTLPSDQVLGMLIQIYAAPPAQSASFIRETALKEISKIDPEKAQALFREHVLDLNSPLDWNQLHSMNLPPSAELDAELIRILEDRWTDRMSRVAPIIGLYASDSILSRVKKVYEVYGPDWPCSIEAGLLTYFLRVDPSYGSEELGPALGAYYDKGGSDCHQGSLLVDIALLRNTPELQPFVVAALNDPRPLVAMAGARVIAFGDQAKIPLPPLLARLHALHDEWQDLDARSGADPEYLKKWNSGYNELERAIFIDFANSGDSAENAGYCRQALEFCITDACRKTIRQRMARSRF